MYLRKIKEYHRQGILLIKIRTLWNRVLCKLGYHDWRASYYYVDNIEQPIVYCNRTLHYEDGKPLGILRFLDIKYYEARLQMRRMLEHDIYKER